MTENKQSRQSDNSRWPLVVSFAAGALLIVIGAVLHPAGWPAVVTKTLMVLGASLVVSSVISFLIV